MCGRTITRERGRSCGSGAPRGLCGRLSAEVRTARLALGSRSARVRRLVLGASVRRQRRIRLWLSELGGAPLTNFGFGRYSV